jgi:ribosomal-protein-alanine N-acetyltransferase
MKIRKFEWKDIKQVLEIENESFDKDRWDEIEFLKYYEEAGNGFIVCEEGARIIGYGIINNEGYIRSIAVRKDWRRKGIGKMILNEMERIAKENKNDILSLHVRVSNKDAIEFYHKNGFKDIMILPKVYHDEDGKYMEKELNTSS